MSILPKVSQSERASYQRQFYGLVWSLEFYRSNQIKKNKNKKILNFIRSKLEDAMVKLSPVLGEERPNNYVLSHLIELNRMVNDAQNIFNKIILS